MHNETSKLAVLAGQVEHGDRQAAQELGGRLDHSLAPIIRHALRNRTANSPLMKQIRALAQKAMVAGRTNPENDPGLVDQIGRMLSQRIVGRLQAQADSFRLCANTVAL